jgi:hypothetical protein
MRQMDESGGGGIQELHESESAESLDRLLRAGD